jgi:ABC-2 type transport system permease protein
MMQRVLNGDIVEHAKPGEVYLAGAELWNRIPDFTYEAPGLGWALRQNALSLGLMGAWLAAAVVFATAATRRVTAE